MWVCVERESGVYVCVHVCACTHMCKYTRYVFGHMYHRISGENSVELVVSVPLSAHSSDLSQVPRVMQQTPFSAAPFPGTLVFN